MINKVRGGSNNTKYVTVLLTNSCNLSCSYCYECNKKSKKISLFDLKQVIDNELSLDDGYDNVKIHLFGGEPFLEFDTLKSIVEYLKGSQWNKKITVFATTNGTILSEDIKKWLVENKDFFSCQLSLDGTKYMHDLNRSNSFDMIDLEFFENTYKPLIIRMTVSIETLPFLSEGIIFSHERGHKVYCTLAKNETWNTKENLSEYKRQLLKLADYYIKNESINPCSLFHIPIQNISKFEKNDFVNKWCGAGNQMRAYDVDKCKYPCQMLMPISTDKDVGNLQFYDKIPKKIINDRCSKCAFIQVCPTCMAENFYVNDSLYHKNISFCEFNKATIYANKLLQFHKWKSGKLILTKNEELHLLRSIQIIEKEQSKYK